MQPDNDEQTPNPGSDTGVKPTVFGPQQDVQPTPTVSSPQPSVNDGSSNSVVNNSGTPAQVQYPVSASDFNKQAKSKNTTRLLAVVVAVLLLVGGSATAYLGLIVPNKPENVWAKALSNTADGYDRLVKYADEQKDVKGADFKGTFKVETGGFATDGSIEASHFEENGFIKADVGLGASRANLEARILKSNTTTPDLYIKVSGIKGLGSTLGSPEVEQIINNVNDQWVFIDHTMLDNLEKQLLATSGQTPQNTQLTPEESLDIFNKTGEALREYIFTDEETKAVFTLKEFVAKEDRGGREMFHYKVGVDKQHLKDFVTSYKDKLKQTKIQDLLNGQSIEEAIQFEELLKQIDTIDTNKAVADAWVDKKTKLFHAVRISDPKTPDTYFEFGTPYTGGDDYPFAMKFVSKENSSDINANFRISVNTKTDAIEFVANVTGDDSTTGEGGSFEMKFTGTPRTEAVSVEKPTDAKPLLEVLGDLGPLFQGVLGARTPGVDDVPALDAPNLFQNIFTQ